MIRRTGESTGDARECGNCSDLSLLVNCVSFGFKYGLPNEADLVFDVRCLPNPFYVEELKNLTGLDEPVRSYVMKWEQTQGFLQRFLSFFFLIIM